MRLTPMRALMLCALLACSDSGTGPDTRVASIDVDPPAAQMEVEDTTRLVAVPKTRGGLPAHGARITWTTDSPAIASVDSMGRVVGLAPGLVMVTAKSGNATATVPITIAIQAIQTIDVAAPNTRVALEDTVTLSATPKSRRGTAVPTAPITWSSSDTTIARVDATGRVIGVGIGTAVITATSGDARWPTPIDVVAPPRDFTVVSAGGAHNCGVTPTGTLYCWGSNTSGQLGLGDAVNRRVPTLVSGGPYTAVFAGFEHTCALLGNPTGGASGGAAVCWGANAAGQLGDGTTTLRRAPTPVAGGVTFVQLALGRDHTCGTTAARITYCWGDNSRGQLGTGTTQSSAVPTPVAGDLEFAFLSAGGRTTCGLTSQGRAHCWGSNSSGQLGIGSTTDAALPQPVSGDHVFRFLTVGDAHTCGVVIVGLTYCWGDNSSGRLGVGFGTNRTTPATVLSTLVYVMTSAGRAHTCGVGLDPSSLGGGIPAGGQAICWGANTAGQLGNGSRTLGVLPAPVSDSRLYTAVFAGGDHTCGLSQYGRAYCWGSNASGQLGANLTAADATTPVRVRLP